MIETVVSWDGHVFSPSYEVDFVQGTEPNLPPATAEMLERIGAWPVVAALKRNPHSMALLVKIRDYTNLDTLRTQLFRWFDPEDETPKKLIAENHAGTQMYRYALCANPGLQLYEDPRHQEAFLVTLAVDGDVRWRAETEDMDIWDIAASGATHVVTNGGEDECYPIYTITPTLAKTGGYAYRRWVQVQWLSGNAGTDYPLCATLATDALVGAGKMQADGDDLRVLVDGIEVYRWLSGMNTASTKIWFNTSFVGAPTLTLRTAIAGAGSIASIEINEDISQLPDTGIVLIGTEAFVYTARLVSDQTLTGITRGAKGTSLGAHNIGDSIYWIQHDIWILYGNATAAAPTVNDAYKPCLELDHSTNTSWVYEVFGQVSQGPRRSFYEARIARWEKRGQVTASPPGGLYTATQRTIATPFTVAGIWFPDGFTFDIRGWSLSNPCGITNVSWSNGLKRRATSTAAANFYAATFYMLRDFPNYHNTQYVIPAPVVANAWEAWSYAGGAFSVAYMVGFYLWYYGSDVEVGDITVTLNNTETPVVTVNAELGNYHLHCTLANTTTGESIALDFVMDLNTDLVVDTYDKTVTWSDDESRQLQALTLSANRTGTGRRAWLRLAPGENTLQFTDTGTNGVTITIAFRERYY